MLQECRSALGGGIGGPIKPVPQPKDHYGRDPLSKGLPLAVHLAARMPAVGNVTATHDLSPIFAALAAYKLVIADSKGNGDP